MDIEDEDLGAVHGQIEESDSLDYYLSQPSTQVQKKELTVPTQEQPVIPQSEAHEIVETIPDDEDDCEVELEILSVSPAKYHLPDGWKIHSRVRKDGKPYNIFESPTGKKYRSYKAVSQELSRIRLQGSSEVLDWNEEVKLVEPKKEKKEPVVKSKYFSENSDEDMKLLREYESQKRKTRSAGKPTRIYDEDEEDEEEEEEEAYYEIVSVADDSPAINDNPTPPTPKVQHIQIHSIVTDTPDDKVPTPQSKPKKPKKEKRKSPEKNTEKKPQSEKKQKTQKKLTPRENFVLPPGWRTEVVYRQSGASQGRADYYWYNPQGKKFRSLKELERYFENLGLPFPTQETIHIHQQPAQSTAVIASGVVENTPDELRATLDTLDNSNNINNNNYSEEQTKSQDLDFLEEVNAQQLYANAMQHPIQPTDIMDFAGVPYINEDFQARDVPIQEADDFVVVMHNQENQAAAESSEGAASSDIRVLPSEDNRSSDSGGPQFLASDGADE